MFVTKVIVSFMFINVLLSAKLPSNFIRCHRNNSKCLKKAIQDAVPKFAKGFRSMGLQGVDPLIIPKMVVPGGGGVVQLTQTFTDSELIGLSTLELDMLDFDLDSGKLDFTFHIARVVFQGNYEMNGQVLVIPVRGNGTMEVTLEGVKGGTKNYFTKNRKGNDEYLQLINNTLLLDADKVVFNFRNLFDGNEELGKQINQALNENWRDVFNEVKDSYNRAFGSFTESIANKLFSQVPVKEVFLD